MRPSGVAPDAGPSAALSWVEAPGVFGTSTGGQVVISTAAGAVFAGTFATTLVTVDDGESPISGSFSAQYCGQ
jgi:hypothetical protein